MEVETNRQLLCPKCLARDGRRVGFRNAELLKRHLCSAVHYNCLAYECPRCTQRCATHKDLDHHLLESHGVQVGMEAYLPDRDPATEANRREVCDMVALAVGRQQGALAEARDDPTVITRVIGLPPVPAAIEEAGLTDARREGPILMPHIQQQQANEAVGPRRQATARVNHRQPVRGGNRGNETPTAPALEAPARAIPPPQMADPVQPQPVVTARGGYVTVNCQECLTPVEDNYPAMRGHALGHAEGWERLPPKALQACIAQRIGSCFPNSRVHNDMTCNSIGCWTDVTPATKSVAHAALWQRTHVEERHIEPTDLNLHCPVDGCPNRNELFPALKKLNEHISGHHGRIGRTSARYSEMKDRVNAKTAEKTLLCFPFPIRCKRQRRGEVDEEAS